MKDKTKKSINKYMKKHCEDCSEVCGMEELIDCIEDTTGYTFNNEELS